MTILPLRSRSFGFSCRAAAASLLLAAASATVLSSDIDQLRDISSSLRWPVPGSAMTFDVSACVRKSSGARASGGAVRGREARPLRPPA